MEKTVAGAVEGINVVFPDDDITSISIGQNILERGVKNVFKNSCSSIENLRIIGTVPHLDTNWLYDSGNHEPYLPNIKYVYLEHVKAIRLWTFCDAEKLIEVRLPKVLNTIEENAFAKYIDGMDFSKLPNITTFIVEDIKSWCSVSLGTKFSNPCYSMSSGAITVESTGTAIDSLDSTNIDGVKEIAAYTFTNCQTLTQINLPNTVESIGRGAFSDCRGITKVVIPNSITSIGDEAFSGCSSITDLSAQNGLELTHLGLNAFQGCSSELFNTSLIEGMSLFTGYIVDATAFPDEIDFSDSSIKGFPDRLFSGRSNIVSVSLGTGFTIVPAEAFFNCTNLNAVTLADDIEIIGKEAFYNCSALKSITIPAQTKTIGESAFSSSGLTGISIPDGVIDIEPDCFSFCDSLKTVKLGRGLSRISTSMFKCSKALKSIEIPANIKVIEDNAFSMYDQDYGQGHLINSLNAVKFNEGLEKIGISAFYCCSNITELTFPNSLEVIGASAFKECSGLQEISFGSTLKGLDDMSFYNCINVSSMTFAGNQPTVGTDAFYGISTDNCTVHIKNGTTGWDIVGGKWHGFTVETYN